LFGGVVREASEEVIQPPVTVQPLVTVQWLRV